MKLKIQKKLAAKISKRSQKRVRINLSRLEDIKEAITRADIKALIKDGAILLHTKRGTSKGRIKKHKKQKQLGRRRGQGTRKGKSNARLSLKRRWISRIRLQRAFLMELKTGSKISDEVYKDLYRKSKGGFFRSKRHIKLYLTEHKLTK